CRVAGLYVSGERAMRGNADALLRGVVLARTPALASRRATPYHGATQMLLTCPSCGKRVSDRAPICPFCSAALPAADIDKDATPARGVTPARALQTPPPPVPVPAPPEPARGDAPLGPFDRVRPLD